MNVSMSLFSPSLYVYYNVNYTNYPVSLGFELIMHLSYNVLFIAQILDQRMMMIYPAIEKLPTDMI